MKKVDSALTAIDLFCGAGALTLGLKHAGFNVVAGIEVNPEIAKTYKTNLWCHYGVGKVEFGKPAFN